MPIEVWHCPESIASTFMHYIHGSDGDVRLQKWDKSSKRLVTLRKALKRRVETTSDTCGHSCLDGLQLYKWILEIRKLRCRPSVKRLSTSTTSRGARGNHAFADCAAMHCLRRVLTQQTRRGPATITRSPL